MLQLPMIFSLVLLVSACSGAPLDGLTKRQAPEEEMPPMPYAFNWEVKDPDVEPNGQFFTHEEQAAEDNPGRVEGSYQVWFEDGRLMTVTYYVDGDSGFVPTVTFEENAQPNFNERK